MTSIRISRLLLHNFRNYLQKEIFFDDKINIIIGENGQGKTNLIEAIALLCTGRPLRTHKLAELISHGKNYFYIEAETEREEGKQIIRIAFDGSVKKLELNHTAYNHFTPLLGQMPAVILTPEDGAIISGSPSDRRRLLDLHLAQTDPLYIYHATRYNKALKQRNALLRSNIEESLESWETIMMGSAQYIQTKRQNLLSWVSDHMIKATLFISELTEQPSIIYKPSITESYRLTRYKEKLQGSTLYGPHRDDFSIFVSKYEASQFASQGQKRSLLAALKFAFWHHLLQVHKVAPILCIDDFSMHLDSRRAKSLLELTASYEQVFLTAPQISSIQTECMITTHEIRQHSSITL